MSASESDLTKTKLKQICDILQQTIEDLNATISEQKKNIDASEQVVLMYEQKKNIDEVALISEMNEILLNGDVLDNRLRVLIERLPSTVDSILNRSHLMNQNCATDAMKTVE